MLSIIPLENGGGAYGCSSGPIPAIQGRRGSTADQIHWKFRTTEPGSHNIVCLPSYTSLADHSEALVNIALSDAPESSIALSILCRVDVERPVMMECLTNSSFTREASALVSHGDIPDLTLSKLAQLTQAAFITSHTESFRSCWFLSSLLSLIANPSVFELFVFLVSDNNDFQQVHTWLISYGFVKDLMNLIRKTPQIDPMNFYGNNEIHRLNNCYRLIELSVQNSSLKKSVKTKEMMLAVSQTVPNSPPFLEGARLRALNSLMSRRWVNEMQDSITHAVEIIARSPGSCQDVVESIRLITRAIDISSELSKSIITTESLQFLVAVVVRNSDASILHAAFRVFVVHALSNDVLRQPVLEQYLPFMVSEARLRLNGQVSATCWFLLNYLFVERDSDNALKSLLSRSPHFCQIDPELKAYRKKLLGNYGGAVPTSIVRKLVPDAY